MRVHTYKDIDYIIYEKDDVGYPEIIEVVPPLIGTYIKDIKGRAIEVINVIRLNGGRGMSMWKAETCLGEFLIGQTKMEFAMRFPFDFDKPMKNTFLPISFSPKEVLFIRSIAECQSIVKAYELIYGRIRRRSNAFQKIGSILSHREAKVYMNELKELLQNKGINTEWFVDKVLTSLDGPIKTEVQYAMLKDLANVTSPEARLLTGVTESAQSPMLPMGKIEDAEVTDITNTQSQNNTMELKV